MELYTLHLFAGAGGGILGDILLGHQPIGAVEIEAYPRKVLLQRQLDGCLPLFPLWDDVTTFRADNPYCASFIERCRAIKDQLCICGGFPCQDISSAGRGAGIDGERSGLWREYARIIGEIRPRYIFAENSPLLTKRGIRTVLGKLAEMGYDAKWGVLGGVNTKSDTDGQRMWVAAKTPEVGWPEMVCGKTIQRTKPNRRPTANDDSCARLDRIRKLECMVGEPAILGGNDGLAYRVDRLAAIGNGQIPAVARLSWETLSR